jgi:uncharacterized protein YjbJ (UPF0337 family)
MLSCFHAAAYAFLHVPGVCSLCSYTRNCPTIQSGRLKQSSVWHEHAKQTKGKPKVTDNSLQDRIQGNWKQLHGSVRHQWGKLTHNDVEEIKGDVEVMAGKIQERYGVTKAEAKKQIDRWASEFQARQTEQSKSDTPAS